jgi:hypothetical protein
VENHTEPWGDLRRPQASAQQARCSQEAVWVISPDAPTIVHQGGSRAPYMEVPAPLIGRQV